MIYKKMLDICSQYGVQFDIRFNPLKSQTSTFGGRHPSHIPLKLNGSVIPATEKVKYLGVYINSLTVLILQLQSESSLTALMTLCLSLAILEMKQWPFIW